MPRPQPTKVSANSLKITLERAVEAAKNGHTQAFSHQMSIAIKMHTDQLQNQPNSPIMSPAEMVKTANDLGVQGANNLTGKPILGHSAMVIMGKIQGKVEVAINDKEDALESRNENKQADTVQLENEQRQNMSRVLNEFKDNFETFMNNTNWDAREDRELSAVNEKSHDSPKPSGPV